MGGSTAAGRFEQAVLFNLSVVALPNGITANQHPTSFVTYPDYLEGTTALSAGQYESAVSGSDGSAVTGITFNGAGDENGAHGMNGISFRGYDEAESTRYIGVSRVGKVVEVTLNGGTGDFHPYHVHINHFQMQAEDDCNGNLYRTGEWRDVVPAQGKAIRWRNDVYSGEVVTHCHILQVGAPFVLSGHHILAWCGHP
jgi:FtsP/CotA-like multicopper oxidase with cupredoxin domain